MSEEKEIKSLEKQFNSFVGKELNEIEYPDLINDNQFNTDNTIINAPYLLNKISNQASYVSAYISNLLDLHLKRGDQLMFKEEAKTYLKILKEITELRVLVNTTVAHKKLN